jgi:hypothetical protein
MSHPISDKEGVSPTEYGLISHMKEDAKYPNTSKLNPGVQYKKYIKCNLFLECKSGIVRIISSLL